MQLLINTMILNQKIDLIIDLKDKVLKTSIGEDEKGVINIDSGVRNEAIQALEVLGFNRNQVDKVVSKLLNMDADMTVENIIKQALNQL